MTVDTETSLLAELLDELETFRRGYLIKNNVDFDEIVTEAELFMDQADHFVNRLGFTHEQYLGVIVEWARQEFHSKRCHPDSRHFERQVLRNAFATYDANLISEEAHGRLLTSINECLSGDTIKLHTNRIKGGKASRKGPPDRANKVHTRYKELIKSGANRKSSLVDLVNEFGVSERQICRDLKSFTDNA